MKKPNDTGMNRTGIGTSPLLSAEMISGVEKLMPAVGAANVDGEATALRISEAQTAGPIGTVPPPATVKGAAKTAIEALKGNKAPVFLDKLGERLAFERTGVRLYDQTLLKYAAFGSWEGGPTQEQLRRIREDELEHFLMIKEVMETLGADPTAMTPAADVVGTLSIGLVKVVSDPRTTLAQTLEAILTAELVDRDGWEMLLGLATSLGKDTYADRFRQALEAEARHLAHVREWLTVYSESAADRTLEETPAPAPTP